MISLNAYRGLMFHFMWIHTRSLLDRILNWILTILRSKDNILNLSIYLIWIKRDIKFNVGSRIYLGKPRGWKVHSSKFLGRLNYQGTSWFVGKCRWSQHIGKVLWWSQTMGVYISIECSALAHFALERVNKEGKE